MGKFFYISQYILFFGTLEPKKNIYYLLDAYSKISNTLKFLPKEQAELLKLSYFYEKTHTDIANDLNIPLGTVKSRIRLALSKMKNLVEFN